MITNGSMQQHWRCYLVTRVLWETDTQIKLQCETRWESVRWGFNCRAYGSSTVDGLSSGDISFQAYSSSASSNNMHVVTQSKTFNKRSSSYSVTLRGSVTLTGYMSGTSSASVSYTIPSIKHVWHGYPTLSAPKLQVRPGEYITLTFKRAARQGNAPFDRLELIQMRSDGSEKVIYSGSNYSYRFKPSDYSSRQVKIKLREVHLWGGSTRQTTADPIVISVAENPIDIYDPYGGLPSVGAVEIEGKTIIIAGYDR